MCAENFYHRPALQEENNVQSHFRDTFLNNMGQWAHDNKVTGNERLQNSSSSRLPCLHMAESGQPVSEYYLCQTEHIFRQVSYRCGPAGTAAAQGKFKLNAILLGDIA